MKQFKKHSTPEFDILSFFLQTFRMSFLHTSFERMKGSLSNAQTGIQRGGIQNIRVFYFLDSETRSFVKFLYSNIWMKVPKLIAPENV